jgi:hypothetical protein
MKHETLDEDAEKMSLLQYKKSRENVKLKFGLAGHASFIGG